MGGESTSAGVDPAAVLAVVRRNPPGTPLTTREVAEALSCSRRTAYDKLETLAADGDVETKKVGARGRVWWRPVGEGDGPAAASGESTATEEGSASVDDRPAAPGDGERSGSIETLEASARMLAASGDEPEIGEAILSALADVVGVADAAVYRFEAADTRLVPVATSAPLTHSGEYRPISAATGSAVWASFVEGTACIVDAAAGPVVPGREGDDGFVLSVPVGVHGVVVAATDDRADAEDARSTVELVATVATMAFDGVAQQRTLREQENRLAEYERRLERATRLTEVLRAIDRALVRATTAGEVHDAVTAALTGEDGFTFAWIGTETDPDSGLTPCAHAGDGRGYLDAVSLTHGEGPVEPAVEAAATGEVAMASTVAEGLRRATWRREALARGLQSVVAVPLAHGDVCHGVLAVYADRLGAVGDRERAVFAELGATIGNALDAIATRERLLCDSAVELEFVLHETDSSVLSAIAEATGSDVRFNGIVPVTQTKARLFLTLEDASVARVEDPIGATAGVESVRVVATRADEHLVAVVATGGTIPATIVDHGASIRTLTVDDVVHVAVDLPAAADVRAFVERFRETYPSAEFIARRERDRPIQTPRGFRAALEERLTDRQREVLETAYYSGLYASPRRTTVGEVAETLGVSQPTVTEHLQAAQAKLFDLVLGDDSAVE